jgi:Flp pilus assembly protein TadB
VVVIAAGTGASGLPLWAVCAIAFVAILGVALIALLLPLAKKQRQAKQARLDEVHRYRVLGAYDDAASQALPSEHGESAVTKRALELMDRVVRARGQRGKLQEELERAGLRLAPEKWAAFQVLVPVGLFAVGWMLFGIIGAIVGAVLGYVGCRMFLRFKTTRRRTAFETQLPDTLQLLASALRTGFGLNQAMATVVREGIDPVSTEFGRALHEVRLGANLEDALDALAVRMQSDDLQLIVMAIRTAREVGGNLAEVLQTTVATMRERVQLKREVRTLTAEGRLSAKVLIALPFLMTGYLFIFRRSYLTPLWTTGVGIAALVAGCILLVVGIFWINRITKIEV